MIPVSWQNITLEDKKSFNRPDTYVKWLIDIAIEAGYINNVANTIWGTIGGDIGDQIDLLNLPISTFFNDAGYITLAEIPTVNDDFDGGSPTDIHLITQKFDGGIP